MPALVTKPDRLADRITNLSHPRDYQLEQVPADLFDNLPTEGQCQNRQSLSECQCQISSVTSECCCWSARECLKCVVVAVLGVCCCCCSTGVCLECVKSVIEGLWVYCYWSAGRCVECFVGWCIGCVVVAVLVDRLSVVVIAVLVDILLLRCWCMS